MKSAVVVFKLMRSAEFAAAYGTCRKYCTAEEEYTLTKKKTIHPYRQIHPWKSEYEFTEHVLKNVIYNENGIVAINKPYGISVFDNRNENSSAKNIHTHNIVKAVDYSIEKVTSHLVKELDVPNLIPCIGAEKFMSGVYVFATNDDVVKQIQNAVRRATAFKKFKKYWAITTRHPSEIKGSYHLAMKLENGRSGDKKLVFVSQWTKNAHKRRDIKIMNVKYKLLSNSTHNLSSLIEIESSAKKWHCIRLFASVMLYSPILGDNYHGSRVQEIMGTWMKIDPFAESCLDMPKVNRQLLDLLKLTPHQQEIIPVHLYLRTIYLDNFGKEKKNIMLEAPLSGPFNWTCQQLKFKNVPCEVNDVNGTSIEDKQISAM